ncbi:MAG: hypothetical protein JWM03_1444, partial [Rhodocyclales bacterium]|nr:hypothetical protein [Rhodocyclales bacterium]
MQRSFITPTLLLTYLLLAACSSTRLSSDWHEQADDGHSPQKLAVIAVVKDDAVSRLVEDEAAHRLPASVHAVAARQLGFTPGADIQTLREKLQNASFDAAVITRLVVIDEQEIYPPPQTYFVDDLVDNFVDNRPMFSPYYRDFWRFYL